MTVLPSQPATEVLPCRYCGNPPGQKVGPPAIARCITPDCKGKTLGAETLADWNFLNRSPPSAQSDCCPTGCRFTPCRARQSEAEIDDGSYTDDPRLAQRRTIRSPPPAAQSEAVAWRKSEYTDGPNADGYFTAGIDVADHAHAIEFHSKNKDEAEHRRDAVLVLLATPPASPSPARITGATDIIDEAACLIFAELCPGIIMSDEDRTHYEAAAKAVLALQAPAQQGEGTYSAGEMATAESEAFERGFQSGREMPAQQSEAVAWRVKNDFGGHWYATCSRALAETWRDVEKYDVDPLYLAPPASPSREEDWSKRQGIVCKHPDGADRCAGCLHYQDPKKYPECAYAALSPQGADTREAVTLRDVVEWLHKRPGISWEATIRDIEKAIADLSVADLQSSTGTDGARR